MFKLDRKKILYFCIYSFASFVVFSITFHEPKMKFISENFLLMGTRGKIQLFVDDIDRGNFAIKSAINRIKNIESLLTKFSPYSEISKINNTPFIYNVVSNDTLFILKFSNQIMIITDGYFDIGVGNLLSTFHIDYIPALYNKIISNNFKYKLFDFSYNNSSIKLSRNNTMIDLGGIGKGFAIDEVIKIFLSFGIKNVAIEFGGDIKINGFMPSGKPWFVTFDDKLSHILNLDYIGFKKNSIAVSGGYVKKSQKSGKIKHHIINPKLLNSNNKYLCMIINGKQNTVCDAVATAGYNMDFMSLCKLKLLLYKYNITIYY